MWGTQIPTFRIQQMMKSVSDKALQVVLDCCFSLIIFSHDDR